MEDMQRASAQVGEYAFRKITQEHQNSELEKEKAFLKEIELLGQSEFCGKKNKQIALHVTLNTLFSL